jgi:hypothetical protein
VPWRPPERRIGSSNGVAVRPPHPRRRVRTGSRADNAMRLRHRRSPAGLAASKLKTEREALGDTMSQRPQRASRQHWQRRWYSADRKECQASKPTVAQAFQYLETQRYVRRYPGSAGRDWLIEPNLRDTFESNIDKSAHVRV